MNPLVPVLFVVGLVAVATVAGLVWRARQGAASTPTSADVVDLRTLVVDLRTLTDADGDAPAPFRARATLVQFSTEYCTFCPSTRRVLTEISKRAGDVSYLDVDVTHRADLVRRFSIMQTPTTLILDADGAIRTRIGGGVRRAVVEEQLALLA
jgi:thiol-disulfide isomerase/thioredoxin